jgi:predicted phosphodiesterase
VPALGAVLAEVRRERVDLVVVGGDVLPGPMPCDALDCLKELPIPATFIHGNGEREVLALAAGKEPTAVPEAYRPAMRWVAGQLQPAHVEWISSWPSTATVHVGGVGEVLFCHATPRSDTELFTRLTPEERIAPAFAGVAVSTVVCGHTHMQFDRPIGAVRVLNAGSVGMPFGPPGAYWLLLDASGVRFRCTNYDRSSAATRIRAACYPGAAEFAEGNVLNPPSEERMLELFTKLSRCLAP